jgi:anhydro-N-acetylmuramic acid kinase
MYIIGLMSGTSADGIDAAICDISGAPPQIAARIIQGITHPYPNGFQQRIHAICQQGRVDEICELNFELGEFFADAVLHVIRAAGLSITDIDLIGSHGQTIWHQVGSDGNVTSTLQITEAAIIAERTGITTIHNFRPRDIAAGGQGAPLTSYADWLLLRHPNRWRAVQNIGGIGNVTFLPPQISSVNPLAFDTGPGNVLIDSAVKSLTEGRLLYDRDGAMARQGQVDEGWLAELMRHPYFDRKPPKTTGRELFSPDLSATLIQQGHQRGLSDNSVIATLTAFTAASIARSYADFAPSSIYDVILGGGGARNPALVAMLQAQLPNSTVLNHEDIGLDSDNKEALVFALLAYETWHGRSGNLPVLTGASDPVILGQITPGRNYADLIRQTWCSQ